MLRMLHSAPLISKGFPEGTATPCDMECNMERLTPHPAGAKVRRLGGKHMLKYLILAAVVAASPAVAANDAVLDACRQEQDTTKRLACYDAIGKQDEADAEKKTGDVTFVSAKLRVQEQDYDKEVMSPRVEMHPTFRKGSKKTVIGIEHHFEITDAFGDVIVKGTDKLNVRIAAGKTAPSGQFYFWEDNPFIYNQPYDKLIGTITNGTAKVTDTVTKVVFSDGSIGL